MKWAAKKYLVLVAYVVGLPALGAAMGVIQSGMIRLLKGDVSPATMEVSVIGWAAIGIGYGIYGIRLFVKTERLRRKQ